MLSNSQLHSIQCTLTVHRAQFFPMHNCTVFYDAHLLMHSAFQQYSAQCTRTAIQCSALLQIAQYIYVLCYAVCSTAQCSGCSVVKCGATQCTAFKLHCNVKCALYAVFSVFCLLCDFNLTVFHCTTLCGLASLLQPLQAYYRKPATHQKTMVVMMMMIYIM